MRLIVDGPLPAAANMARDEALLHAGPRPDAPRPSPDPTPTLRFYQWAPPAVSLGYFQPIDAYDRHAAELAGYGLVRRPTGGGAILHHCELTYSLAVPAGWPILAGRPTRLYELAHEAIRGVLIELGVPAAFHAGPSEGNTQRGPFFCFARRHPYDLVVANCGPAAPNGQSAIRDPQSAMAKIVGSAQRRLPEAILQHGTIIVRRVGPQPCTGINDHRSPPVAIDELAARLADRFAAAFGAELRPGALTAAEAEAARRLEAKYASPDWTRQR